jgi:hypothetical protein
MKEVGLGERILGLLYALEVQYAVEENLMDELGELQMTYEIPEQSAVLIIESTCKKYLEQIVTLALRASRRYEEREAVAYMEIILKYVRFLPEEMKILADPRIFQIEDIERLIGFYFAEKEFQRSTNNVDTSSTSGGEDDSQDRLVNRVRTLIQLSNDYIPPELGIEGLLGVNNQALKATGKSSGNFS